MHIKYSHFIIFLLGCGLALSGCAKEVVEESPSAEGEEPAPVVEERVETPVAEEIIPEEVEEPTEELTVPEAVAVEPVVVPRQPSRDVEQTGDSASYLYMIRPNDYLVKIATREYGDPTRWRNIYNWNLDLIGDNPNLIYPYHELELFKPVNEIMEWEYDYSIHVVTAGETLWSIAAEEYGDPIAWIVIFWDNETVLGSNAGQLKPGMELAIRTALWPDS